MYKAHLCIPVCGAFSHFLQYFYASQRTCTFSHRGGFVHYTDVHCVVYVSMYLYMHDVISFVLDITQQRYKHKGHTTRTILVAKFLIMQHFISRAVRKRETKSPKGCRLINTQRPIVTDIMY